MTTYIAVSTRDERLIPLYRRDCEIPALLKPILGIDFRNDDSFEETYEALLHVIKKEAVPRRSRTPANSPAKLSPRKTNFHSQGSFYGRHEICRCCAAWLSPKVGAADD